MNRVAITGVGALGGATPGAEELTDRLLAGHSGVAPDPLLGGASSRAGAVPRRRETRRLERSADLFYRACEASWRDAGLEAVAVESGRIALVEGSSLGAMADLLTVHADQLAAPRRRRVPGALLRYLPGAGGSAFAQQHGIAGAVLHLSAGSVSAACALGEAAARIRSGDADIALAGGAECPLHAEIVDAFQAAGVLSADGRCRPFDRRRSGTVLGEGAGAMVLESESHARRRGARIRGWLDGYALVTESHSMLAPDPAGRGVTAAAGRALRDAGVDDLAFVKAHGTGTRLNDAAECRGLAALLGRRLAGVPLVALKPALGHALGASGVIEGVVSVLALERGMVPPTLDAGEPDPDLPGCRVAPRAEAGRGGSALLLSESFGGRCAALVVRRERPRRMA